MKYLLPICLAEGLIVGVLVATGILSIDLLKRLLPLAVLITFFVVFAWALMHPANDKNISDEDRGKWPGL